MSEVRAERVDLRLVQRIQERRRTATPIAVGGLVAPDQAAELQARIKRLHASDAEFAQVRISLYLVLSGTGRRACRMRGGLVAKEA